MSDPTPLAPLKIVDTEPAGVCAPDGGLCEIPGRPAAKPEHSDAAGPVAPGAAL